MRLLIQHQNHYLYPAPAALGPQLVRLRPANHAKAKIETYSLQVGQESELRWQQDPYGNHVARVTFKAGTRVTALDLKVELAVDIRPVNPFDFFVDDRCKMLPFEYPAEARQDLLPFRDTQEASVKGGPLLASFLAELPRAGETVPLIVAINAAVNQRVRYVIREESGIWTPEETLAAGRGSCRDSAVLLIAALRSRGLAARFVSGYLVQLTDEGMIPDQPKGMGRDVVDLHAWAEVFLPGGGWIGLDATSGLLCGEGHIPLACTAVPPLAAPLEGTSDVAASAVTFEMKVARLGHEPRPTTPYEETTWDALLDAADTADGKLRSAGLTLTSGGEPTFNAREDAAAAEWNTEALGPGKWTLGLKLAHVLRARLAPGGVVLVRSGKHYPGESLPRWALDICVPRDGSVVWGDTPPNAKPATLDDARRVASALAERLGLSSGLQAAYEDPWRFLQDEASLPIDEDPLKSDLHDPEERRRLARVLDRGLGEPAGYVLPLARTGGAWRTEPWEFRRGHLFLLPGDSAIGLRLPLRALPPAPPPPLPPEVKFEPRDPRANKEDETPERAAEPAPVRTALCVEERDGVVHVFVPPFTTAEDFFALVREIDAVRHACGVDVLLEGYPPPSGPTLRKFSVTPDPGVLEVNVEPSTSGRAHARLLDLVFEAALQSGLHSEKYMLDGRLAGSGGGNHITLGGPTPLSSPFASRPDILASLITFVQHHPSLSYMFSGLFVGPTSQAPRVDEARHDALYEMELALARAFDRSQASTPWLADMLFRHLLVDVTGNTHRTEICIDKLFDPLTPTGRQGLLELRAFEMPPHPRMAAAQVILLRSIVAAFAAEPYRAPLVRWGQLLHDRFLLPHWMWQDFEDVLAELARRGVSLPAEAYRPFVELRCPVVGTLHAGDVILEVRNAIEPWHVLGEEPSGAGTSRYVDSSMERIEVRAQGLVPERHQILVNGHLLPMRPTGNAGEHVAGVRFRAWAPPHSLHAYLGIHHPLRLDVLDTWGRRSLGACAYHVWHPGGRGFEAPPLTRFEAAARRAQRFTSEGPLTSPVVAQPTVPSADAPYSLDLRRYPGDRPPPEPEPEEEPSP